jgi:hypothetical protein
LIKGKFFPIEQNEARQSADDYLKTNLLFSTQTETNLRKQIDLTIKAFAEFAVDKPDTFLYLHMSEKDLGWDVRAVFDAEMRSVVGIPSDNRMVMTSI